MTGFMIDNRYYETGQVYYDIKTNRFCIVRRMTPTSVIIGTMSRFYKIAEREKGDIPISFERTKSLHKISNIELYADFDPSTNLWEVKVESEPEQG